MAERIVGFESANSFVKIYTKGKKPVIYPNTLSDVAKEQFGELTGTKTIYEVEGKRYNVGKTLQFHSSSMASKRRYGTENYKIESLIAISQVVENGDNVIACTGLPANHYSAKEAITKMIEGQLLGPREVTINGIKKSFVISKVIVTLQPLATFFFSLLDVDGTSDDDMTERVSGTKSLIIDIGWGSTDVADCISGDLVDFFSLQTTMKDMYVLLLEKIKDKFKGEDISTATIDLLELEKQFRKSTTIKYGNSSYDCADVYDLVVKEITSKIILEVYTKRELEEYTTVIFTGGGTEALRSQITKEFWDVEREDVKSNIFLMNADNSQIANAKGYYVYATFLQPQVV